MGFAGSVPELSEARLGSRQSQPQISFVGGIVRQQKSAAEFKDWPMKTQKFLLFRLNLVDREMLFENRITDDLTLFRVIESATDEQFDVDKRGPRTSYKWALREATFGAVEQLERPFISVTFSCGVMSRKGPIVTPRGIVQGTSSLNPPAATLVLILIDLKRHICAVENVPSVMSGQPGWKGLLQTILASAAWKLGFTSMIHLEPIAPEETVEIALKSWDRITRLRVALRIPNPDLGPSYRHLYEEMKRSGVREIYQDMRNESGLTLESDTLPQASIDMSLKGYRGGPLRLNGYKNGRKDELTVDDEVASIEVDSLQSFIEGYAAGQKSAAVKAFARTLIDRIEENVGRKSHEQI